MSTTQGYVDSALIKYLILAEQGYEVAQANVAYILDKGIWLLLFKYWSRGRWGSSEKGLLCPDNVRGDTLGIGFCALSDQLVCYAMYIGAHCFNLDL